MKIKILLIVFFLFGCGGTRDVGSPKCCDDGQMEKVIIADSIISRRSDLMWRLMPLPEEDAIIFSDIEISEVDSLPNLSKYVFSIDTVDTVTNEICKQRGHVPGGVMSSTLICCSWVEVIDLPGKTILRHHDPNTITYICQRCGQQISESGKTTETVTW